LSGDDELLVRALYCDPFMMKIQFLLMFMTNQ